MARSDNLILSALSPSDFDFLAPNLEAVELASRHVIEEPDAPVKFVYFLEAGLASVVAGNPAGHQVEVALFGREGMSGICLVNGADQTPLTTWCQIPGRALRITCENFVYAMAARPGIREMFLRYSQAHAIQMAHTGLSNGRHTIDQRLARWLLMSQDRMRQDELMLTHGFLAMMLGVRRAGVTTALHILEGSRVIKATRGLIQIRNRAALEAAAGDAYGVPEAEYRRLFSSVLAPGAF